MAEFGYAGEILKVDLSDGKVNRLPTKAKLEELHLNDVSADLAGRGLMK